MILVIWTAGRPWRSKPSRALLASLLLAVSVAMVLPYTPAAGALGFVSPPPGFFLFLVIAVATYLALVESVKRRFYRRYGV